METSPTNATLRQRRKSSHNAPTVPLQSQHQESTADPNEDSFNASIKDGRTPRHGAGATISQGGSTSHSSQQKSASTSTLPSFPSTCRILSYNMNLLPLGYGQGDGFKDERLHEFADRCESNYDVLILQEVYASSLVPLVAQPLLCSQRRLLDLLEKKGFAFYALPRQPSYYSILKDRRRATAATDAGLIIVSRYPIVLRGFHALQPPVIGTSGADVNSMPHHSTATKPHAKMSTNKGIVFAKIQLTKDHAVLIFNVHTQPLTTPTLSITEQRSIITSQASEVRQFVEFVSHEHPNCPAIIAGDFNVNSIRPSSRSLSSAGSSPIRTSSSEALDGFDSAGGYGRGRIARQTDGDDEGDAWQFACFVATMDPQHKLSEVILAQKGYHPPTRPRTLEYPTSLQAVDAHIDESRPDYVFFRPANTAPSSGKHHRSSHTQNQRCLGVVDDTAHIEKFSSAPGSPFEFLSDHFGVGVEVGLFAPAASSNTTPSRTHAALVSELSPKCPELLEADVVKSASNALAQQEATTGTRFGLSNAVSNARLPAVLARRREDWTKALTAATGSERTGYGLSKAIESVVIPLILYQLWAVPWLRYVLLLVTVLVFAKFMFGNQVLHIKKLRNFGRVTDAVKMGLAPVALVEKHHDAEGDLNSAKPSTLASLSSPTTSPESGSMGTTFPPQSTKEPVTYMDTFKHVVSVVGWRPALSSRAPTGNNGTNTGFPGGGNAISYLSFKDVEQRVLTIAANLQRNACLRKGNCVGIFAEASTLTTLIDMACALQGYVTVPLAGDSKLVRHLLDVTETRVVVTSRFHTSKVLISRSRTLQQVFQVDTIEAEEKNIALETGVKISPCYDLLQEHPSTTTPQPGTSTITTPTSSSQLQSNSMETPLGSNLFTSTATSPSHGLNTGLINKSDVATILFSLDDTIKIPPGTVSTLSATVKLHPKTHADLLEELQVLEECNLLPPSAVSNSGSRSNTSSSFDALSGNIASSEKVLIVGQFHNFFERMYSLGFLLRGLQVSHGTSAGDDLQLFAPTTVCANTLTFQLLHGQYQQVSRRWRWAYRSAFDKAFAFRSKLIRLGRDSKSLRWAFCNQFRQQFGGNLRRIVLLNSSDQVPVKLKEFISTCYSPLLREVIHRQEVGIISIDGIPAPRRVVRLVALSDTPAVEALPGVLHGSDAAMEQQGLGVLQLKTQPLPSTTATPQQELMNDSSEFDEPISPTAVGGGWSLSGLVAKWENDRLKIACPVDAILWPAEKPSPQQNHQDAAAIPSSFVNALDVERKYRQGFGSLFTNLFITCDFGKPLVAIIVPNRDAMIEWIKEKRLSSDRQKTAQSSGTGAANEPLLDASSTWPQFVTVASNHIRSEFKRLRKDRDLPATYHVAAVHLHPHAFTQHSDFINASFQQRRTRVTTYFARHVHRLYEDLGVNKPSGSAGNHPPQLTPVTASPAQTASQSGGVFGDSVSNMMLGASPLQSPLAATTSPFLTSVTGGKAPPALDSLLPSATAAIGGGNRKQSSPQPQGNDATNARPLSFVAPVAVDIGGTCCKVVYFRPPGAPSGLPDYCHIDDSNEFERVISLSSKPISEFFVDGGGKAESEREGDPSSPSSSRMLLRFAKMPSTKVPDFIDFVEKSGVKGHFKSEAVARIPATGGGAYKFSRLAGEKLGVTLEPCKEMDGIIKGLNFLLHYASSSIFAYDFQSESQQPHQLNNTAPEGEEPSVFPYLLVNIGSGVSIVKCTGPDGAYVRVGGSAIGGATFWGLVRSLTSIRTWEEVHEMTRVDGPGDNTNIDLLVGDIYGFNATNLPQRLTVDTVASTFGKLGADKPAGGALNNPHGGGGTGASTHNRGGSSDDGDTRSTPSTPNHQAMMQSPLDLLGGEDNEHEHSGRVGSGNMTPQLSADMPDGVDATETLSHCSGLDEDDQRQVQMSLTSPTPRAVDIVRSLLIMIANNVTQLAYLTCRAENVKNVFFTGGFVRDNPVVWKQITKGLMYWTNNNISAHFLLHDGYLGALGSLLGSAPVPGTDMDLAPCEMDATAAAAVAADKKKDAELEKKKESRQKGVST